MVGHPAVAHAGDGLGVRRVAARRRRGALRRVAVVDDPAHRRAQAAVGQEQGRPTLERPAQPRRRLGAEPEVEHHRGGVGQRRRHGGRARPRRRRRRARPAPAGRSHSGPDPAGDRAGAPARRRRWRGGGARTTRVTGSWSVCSMPSIAAPRRRRWSRPAPPGSRRGAARPSRSAAGDGGMEVADLAPHLAQRDQAIVAGVGGRRRRRREEHQGDDDQPDRATHGGDDSTAAARLPTRRP
jgi:hypothetical protein